MKTRSFLLWATAATLILTLTGCNLPRQSAAGVQTAAALTVQAALTSAAPSATFTSVAPPSQAPTAAAPASATPPPSATVPVSCDKSQFISETVPDNSTFSGGEDFTKTWTLKNTGTCSWTPSYSLVFVSGDALGGSANSSLAANVNPGQSITVSVNLEAPDGNGTYHGNWGLRNAAGVIFANFWVQIKVASGGGAFAVTHVTYTFSLSDFAGKSNCPMMTAHITTNGPGEVVYHWTRSDGASASTQNVTFAAAGTKDVVTQWALGSVWAGDTHWLGIYIDEPNHQDFGHKTFTQACAP
ncbi:MAG TPA: NBR1-Ig-like domain-containing protein [Anaerolineales bacterium]